MNYAAIKKFDIANGTGVRVSLFVSGCTHHCKDCFNAQAWDFHYGEEFNEDVMNDILQALSLEPISGLSLLGGEPMEPDNQIGLLPLLRKFHDAFPNKDVWCYTGYLFEDLIESGKVHTQVTDELLSYIDILVDGPFVAEKKNIRLQFRGSENQRIIDVQKSLKNKRIILWDKLIEGR